jgi:hypothetical protein
MDALERMQALASFVVRVFQGDISEIVNLSFGDDTRPSPLLGARLGADSRGKF